MQRLHRSHPRETAPAPTRLLGSHPLARNVQQNQVGSARAAPFQDMSTFNLLLLGVGQEVAGASRKSRRLRRGLPRSPTIVSVAIAVIVVTVVAGVTNATEVIARTGTSEAPAKTVTAVTIETSVAVTNLTEKSDRSREHGCRHVSPRGQSLPRALARAWIYRLNLVCLGKIGIFPTVRRW